MPPALSESEHSSSDVEHAPPPNKGKGKGKAAVEADPIEDTEEDDSEGDDDEYVVEAIHGHRFQKGVLQFDVKWEGYDDPRDRTWESEENMTGAADVLKEYFDSIGGRPAKGQKRKGRQSVGGTKSESATPAAASVKRIKQEKEWSPPPGSWEHDVSYVETVEQTPDPKTGQLTKFGYLCWNNQKKTSHPLHHIYQKCPQKMLLYYESHLVFKDTSEVDAAPIGTNDSNGNYLNDEDGNNVIMNDSF